MEEISTIDLAEALPTNTEDWLYHLCRAGRAGKSLGRKERKYVMFEPGVVGGQIECQVFQPFAGGVGFGSLDDLDLFLLAQSRVLVVESEESLRELENLAKLGRFFQKIV